MIGLYRPSRRSTPATRWNVSAGQPVHIIEGIYRGARPEKCSPSPSLSAPARWPPLCALGLASNLARLHPKATLEMLAAGQDFRTTTDTWLAKTEPFFPNAIFWRRDRGQSMLRFAPSRALTLQIYGSFQRRLVVAGMPERSARVYRGYKVAQPGSALLNASIAEPFIDKWQRVAWNEVVGQIRQLAA